MAELSLDQQKAVALASARLRAQQAQPQAPDDHLQRSMLLPLAKNTETGSIEMALPKVITGIPGLVKGMVQGVADVAAAPGDAMSGKLQVMGPDGNVSPEAIAKGAEFAATFSPMNPAVRAGEAILPGARAAFRDVKVKPPSADELKAASSAQYDALRGLDAQYSSQSISDMAARVEQTLAKSGINEKTAPSTVSTLRELQKPPEGSFVSSSDLETMRRTFGEIGQNFNNPTDRNASKFARGAIDNFLSKPDVGSVLPGSEAAAAQAGELAGKARGNYAAGKRSDSLSGLVTAAEDRAGASGSGANIGNSIRQRAASVLGSKKASSAFTSDELDSLRAVARGTIPQNVTRRVGNMLGGGGGLGAAIAGGLGAAPGVAAGSPWMAAAGIALPAAGAAAKTASNMLTERALMAVDKATRSRSPLFEEMQKAAGREPVVPTREASFLRSLLMGAQVGGQPERK